jgi:hypothetical protein
MTDFIDYEVGEIRMRLPSYLRQRKRGHHYFQTPRRRGKGNEVLGLGVDLVSEEHAGTIRTVMADAKFFDWEGIQRRVVRRGATPYPEGGFELLFTSFDTATGNVSHSYTVIFKRQNIFINISMHGTGDIDRFYAICTEIASSIKQR